MNEEMNELQGEKVTENVWRCPDGVYRWTYEYHMLKNPTILFTVWKVLGLSCGIVAAIGLLFSLFNGDITDTDYLLGFGKALLIGLGVILVLGVVAYLILAVIYGGKYQVLFEMTDETVRHIQMDKQFKKVQALGWLNVLAGIAAGNPAAVGQGLMVSVRNSMTSELKNVKNIKVRRGRHTIYVNQTLNKNQVYAEDADFDFVENFLKEHCTGAKIVS